MMAGPVAVVGHEGPPRILVEPATVNPGGTVVVRGEDLSAEATIALAIIGANARVELETETTDGEGHFTRALVIPYDIAEGRYAIEGTSPAGDVYRVEVLVSGAPILPREGGSGRDEDDPLLIPLPSGWQQSLSEPAVTAPPVAGSGSGAINVPLDAAALLSVVAFLVGAVAASVIERRRSRV